MTGSALRTFATVTNDWSQADQDRSAVIHGACEPLFELGPNTRWLAAQSGALARIRAERALEGDDA
ncbi:hypothetical protein GCM10009106_08510 [Sphingomonas japonica]